tara:strand:+ start:1201 stop:1527 length:327 start_codon:yes stop_codon:yes gene_type:complete
VQATKKHKVNLFVRAVKRDHSNGFVINVNTFEVDGHLFDHETSIKLGSVEVEIDIPDIDLNGLNDLEIEQIKERIVKEKNESHLKIQAYEERIQSLLCIEHTDNSGQE